MPLHNPRFFQAMDVRCGPAQYGAQDFIAVFPQHGRGSVRHRTGRQPERAAQCGHLYAAAMRNFKGDAAVAHLRLSGAVGSDATAA